MRRSSPEAWMFVAFIVAIVLVPILVGLLIVKAYRSVRPIEVESANTLASLHQKTHDGFFVILLTGWIVCGPLFYWFYSVYLN
ncbi:MAG: hypothetical protein ACPH9N_05185 [Alteromonas sp.]